MPIFDKIAKNSILRICKPLKLPQHHHVNGYLQEATDGLDAERCPSAAADPDAGLEW
jgi:hypothetical protein